MGPKGVGPWEISWYPGPVRPWFWPWSLCCGLVIFRHCYIYAACRNKSFLPLALSQCPPTTVTNFPCRGRFWCLPVDNPCNEWTYSGSKPILSPWVINKPSVIPAYKQGAYGHEYQLSPWFITSPVYMGVDSDELEVFIMLEEVSWLAGYDDWGLVLDVAGWEVALVLILFGVVVEGLSWIWLVWLSSTKMPT